MSAPIHHSSFLDALPRDQGSSEPTRTVTGHAAISYADAEVRALPGGAGFLAAIGLGSGLWAAAYLLLKALT